MRWCRGLNDAGIRKEVFGYAKAMVITMQSVRLQKYISDCGLMSRRAAEREIAAGAFSVNGIRAQIGCTVDPETDEITYRNQPLKKAEDHSYAVLMLNKPKGYVTTMHDEKGRPCVSELVGDFGSRVYPCGRLDMDSEGLLLLTNDGALANKLTHPSHHIPKVYHVRVNCEITPEQLSALNRPMRIDDYLCKPAHAVIVTRKQDYTVLAITLYEGRNRQIRKMCEQLDMRVLALKRVAIGELKLGTLKTGMWKKLTRAQYEYLKKYGDGGKTGSGHGKGR